MPLAVLAIALIAWLYAMVAAPRFRIPGAIGFALLAAGLGWYFYASESEAERAAARLAPEDVTLDLLEIDRTARGAVLRGRVANGGDAGVLREMTLEMRLFDCPDEDAALDDCVVIGDATGIARVAVPPGQARGFSASFIFPGLPPVVGVLRWDQTITALRATD